jgi:hypothetical protein
MLPMWASQQEKLMTWASSQKSWVIFTCVKRQLEEHQSVEQSIHNADEQREQNQEDIEASGHSDK